MTLTLPQDAYELGRATAEAGNPRVSPFADRELNEAFEKGWDEAIGRAEEEQ